jgi:60S ribosome subunit biogenesis protein NIP7
MRCLELALHNRNFWRKPQRQDFAKISLQRNILSATLAIKPQLNSLSHLNPSLPTYASIMRSLTETETQALFSKLANYTGRSLNHLIEPPTPTSSDNPPDRHVFRLHASRVYYVRLSLANLATSIARPNLLSLGTCLGKFTKTGKFRMHITALDIIAPHARYKVWVKPNGEMPFVYGGNIVKAHVGRWSEDCPEHQGVVVLGMDDTPLVCWAG